MIKLCLIYFKRLFGLYMAILSGLEMIYLDEFDHDFMSWRDRGNECHMEYQRDWIRGLGSIAYLITMDATYSQSGAKRTFVGISWG